MNYPIWETTYFGGGTWIALISVLHVYISQLAVGGGIYIWLTDWKAWRENNQPLHDYLQRYTWFFLYLTMVFGGVSGVGIWFIIGLVHPAGTSVLIHNFVFGWAIEWVFFIGEITALILYAYRFKSLNRKSRQTLAFLYALFAWLSLFVVNGVLSFMITPGKWLTTHNFWDGFFNPAFLPSLVFRTATAVMLAGLFGYVTSVFTKEARFRTVMLRYCSGWLLYPIPFAALAGVWFFTSIPESIRLTAFGQNHQTAPFMALFAGASVVLFLLGVGFTLRSGLALQRAATILIVPVGLVWVGGFEYLREIARKPYVISGLMYSNAILAADQNRLNQEGALTQTRWTAIRTITPANQVEAGHELFNMQCLACHTIGGIRNDIIKRIDPLSYRGILSHLEGQGRLLTYMPPVLGTPAEKEALAVYLAGLSGKEIPTPSAPAVIPPIPTEVPPRIEAKDKEKYVLLAWNNEGIHHLSDCDPWFGLMPAGNILEAQLIHCGLVPEILGDTCELSYRMAAKPANGITPTNLPSAQDAFAGKLLYDAARKSYQSPAIPVRPDSSGGQFDPYPLFVVEAREKKTGNVLASVNVVAPVSTEIGCGNCHGGSRSDGRAGISKETAQNILRAHDRINKTDLLQKALAGNPQACQSCHADPATAAKGQPGILNLSAAIHGWHANYMRDDTAQACALCHPSGTNGSTRFNRGIHAVMGLTCIQCHGTMTENALALLEGQKAAPAVPALTRHLAPMAIPAKAPVAGRTPWVNEPECLSCHEKFEPPKANATSVNRWSQDAAHLYRQRVDDSGLRCIACHGATHAEYPALNPFHPLRDNLQPLQYAGKPFPIGAEMTCETCHLEKMESPIHHENMDRPFRNRAAWEKATPADMATTPKQP